MKSIGKDKNPNGSDSAYATARLDIDYPGEDGDDHNRLELFGYASVYALGSGGFYSIQATAYMVHNAKSKKWWGFIYNSRDADVIINYDNDLTDAWAKDYFYLVSAKAYLTNSVGEKFEGEAKDFSHGEPTTWVCKDQEGNDNHGGNETCNVCE